MNEGLRLAELLAMRLCHDLSGPLGTLMGSIDMVNEDPEVATEALATEVSVSLAKRLRFLRAAWGGPTAALSTDELREIAQGLPQGRRVAVCFDNLSTAGAFPPAAARVMLNLLLLAAESLPGGGVVTVAGDPSRDVTVSIAGPRAAWPTRLAAFMVDEAAAWAALADEGSETSRAMQGPLTALIARASGMRLGFLMAVRQESAPPLILSPAA